MKRIMMVMVPAVGLLILAGLYFSMETRSGRSDAASPERQQGSPKVNVTVAERADIADRLALTGSVEACRIARLASPAEGPVVELAAREGDAVRSGERLLVIGRGKSARALIVSLREELRKESDNLRRVRRLVEEGALPSEKLDQARVAHENVRARLVKAKEAVEDHTITAPWSGIVFGLHVREGEFVTPRATLLELYDPSSLVIRAAVPERHVFDVAAGGSVEVKLDAYPDKVLPGRIERVYPHLDARLRTRTIEIVLKESVELLPGMFARLRLSRKSISGAVVVPVDAIVSTPEKTLVFVIEEGKAVARPVKTGIEDGNRVQIVRGIDAGDTVVVSGKESLKDGMAVRLNAKKTSANGSPSVGSEALAEKENRTEGGRP